MYLSFSFYKNTWLLFCLKYSHVFNIGTYWFKVYRHQSKTLSEEKNADKLKVILGNLMRIIDNLISNYECREKTKTINLLEYRDFLFLFLEYMLGLLKQYQHFKFLGLFVVCCIHTSEIEYRQFQDERLKEHVFLFQVLVKNKSIWSNSLNRCK